MIPNRTRGMSMEERPSMRDAWLEALWLSFWLLRFFAAILLSIVAIWMATSSSLWYRGDGVLRDYTPMHPGHRYVLDLGSVDLRKDGVYQFEVGPFPPRTFNPGLWLTLPEPFPDGTLGNRPDGKAQFTLIGSMGEVVFSDVADMGSGWSVALGRDIAFVAAGYDFVPEKGERYSLLIDIAASNVSDGYSARIVMASLGWK